VQQQATKNPPISMPRLNHKNIAKINKIIEKISYSTVANDREFWDSWYSWKNVFLEGFREFRDFREFWDWFSNLSEIDF